MKKNANFAPAKCSKMVCTDNHKVVPLPFPHIAEHKAKTVGGCIYNHTTLPLFYYVAENKTNTEYGYEYSNGFSSTATKSLTSDFCVNLHVAGDTTATPQKGDRMERSGMIYEWTGSDYKLVGQRGLEPIYPELLFVGIAKGLVNMVAKIGMQSIGEYTITRTVANNLATRPYINSPSTITNIMKSGKGVPDAWFKGGMNYKVPGNFNGSNGIWELGINPETNTIYHFLFKSVKF